MLEIMICLIGGLYLLATGDSEIKPDIKHKEVSKNKWDNYTTYEIDQYIKENNLDYYNGLSRESKIRKLNERGKRW